MATSMMRRVLVHLQKPNDVTPTPAKFTQCVLDCFGTTTPTMEISVDMNEDHLIITDSKYSDGKNCIRIKHPPFCPVQKLSADEESCLSPDILNRGIDVGAAVIVESADNKILLTRRAYHMRTFPGVWVPPGGHIEVGEQFQEAGLRELKEETGLDINPSICESKQLTALAAWESVFPPRLSRGSPKRHHVVVYLHAKLVQPYTAEILQGQIAVDDKEVGAYAWLNRQIIEGIVATNEGEDNLSEKIANVPETFHASVIQDGHTAHQTFPTSNLLAVVPEDGSDIERVSTGTKFVLGEWLKLTKQQEH
ncbi:nucleoside diphosphate-linked moiety X motif 17 [Lingula anatina]|uniref:m7GpppN-mRNA hydrolase NUDT17 n=1 Tax=Lingula anatina TaxID=7574 RepID=A0A2R2MSJ8_LINAN|nr:nucleoside diphosphate-linked moiety X motif 17 [Lingula anatina]|eukprot:XP_023933103.1 nucleoside diphosphate-linked moiety X motif 17 [Lingula anatina]